MKYANAFKWLSVILVIAVMIPAIGCGKKEAQEPTPTPTPLTTPILITPLAGENDVILMPILEWSSVASAISYELIVAKLCDWANPAISLNGSSAVNDTVYQVTTSLEADTHYCWKVRAVGDNTSSAWSDTGTFTTY